MSYFKDFKPDDVVYSVEYGFGRVMKVTSKYIKCCFNDVGYELIQYYNLNGYRLIYGEFTKPTTCIFAVNQTLFSSEVKVADINNMKFDDNKPQLSLIDPKFIIELGTLMTKGVIKYKKDSWKLVKNGKERYADALLRHLYAYLDGEQFDMETKTHHLIAVAFNTMALRYFERKDNELNN